MLTKPLTVALAAVLLAAAVLPAEARPRRKHRRAHATRPLPALTTDGRPNVQSKSWIVVDYDTGEVLEQRNADEVRPIASLSKLAAALVVVERKPAWTAKTAITDDDQRVARGGARSRLPVGASLTNLDLLHAALISSDNRAVPALGRAVGLTPPQLAQAMTKKARALGLKATRFEEPTGLGTGNVSTAREVVGLLKASLADPLLAEIQRKHEHDATVEGGRYRQVHYVNTDRILRGGQFKVLGGKTGYTDEARYCLVIAAEVAGRRVAMAFLGAEGELTRFGDFTRVAEWMRVKSKGRQAQAEPGPPARGAQR
jgi:D-alanyl-D-alanine endopeptidase (penicillin-binding protein 7)